jgi:hypothetical protein
MNQQTYQQPQAPQPARSPQPAHSDDCSPQKDDITIAIDRSKASMSRTFHLLNWERNRYDLMKQERDELLKILENAYPLLNLLELKDEDDQKRHEKVTKEIEMRVAPQF